MYEPPLSKQKQTEEISNCRRVLLLSPGWFRRRLLRRRPRPYTVHGSVDKDDLEPIDTTFARSQLGVEKVLVVGNESWTYLAVGDR